MIGRASRLLTVSVMLLGTILGTLLPFTLSDSPRLRRPCSRLTGSHSSRSRLGGAAP
jgi:hypothetical protein